MAQSETQEAHAVRLLTLCLLLSLNLRAAEIVPRGIRNNNPGNIRSSRVSFWPGAVGMDAAGYLIFAKPVDGIRAVVINLKCYRDKYGINSPIKIAKRWTQGEDKGGQHWYAHTLAKRFNYVMPNIHGILNMTNSRVLEELTKGIIEYECGEDPYSEESYSQIFPDNYRKPKR